MSIKEKILNWYFTTHKIEDKLGHNPYLEADMVGKIENSLTSLRFKAGTLSVMLAACFHAAATWDQSNLWFVLLGPAYALFAETKARFDRSSWTQDNFQTDYYIDTSPEKPVVLPNDVEILRHLQVEYEACHPREIGKRTVNVSVPFVGVVATMSTFGDIDRQLVEVLLPYFAGVLVTKMSEEGRQYWQARQVLNENWQVHGTRPEKQTERERLPNAAPSPNI
jgi:hypothetical protein